MVGQSSGSSDAFSLLAGEGCCAQHSCGGQKYQVQASTPGELETQWDTLRVAACLVHLLKSVNPGAKSGQGSAVHLAETLC